MPRYGNRTAATVAAKRAELERADDVATVYLTAERAVRAGMDRRTLLFGLAGYLGLRVAAQGATNGNAAGAENTRGA